MQNAFFTLKGVELKYTERVSFYKIIKIVGFPFEARSSSTITLTKIECVVIYHGNNNGNHDYCGKRLK